jgi:circadian clock protein KaiC
MTVREGKTLARLTTGIPALDAALNGGLPVESVSVIAGEPGAGKTVLAMQAMFAAARAGKRCLYFTTLSEPSLKLMRYMRLFDFFDEELVASCIGIHDLGSKLRGDDPEAALQDLGDTVAREEPALVVVDSFKAIHDRIPDAHRGRTFSYDLAVQMAAWGATTVLVGEYTLDELGTCAEFAIADGIIRLSLSRQELAHVRELEIRKLRGSSFVTGVHFFDIDSSGISFYPRVRAPEPDGAAESAPADRVATGVQGLDELFRGGGIPEASATLVLGGTGTGKTLLGLHFLVEGARRGQPGVLFILEESAAQIRSIGDSFGFDVSGLERRGLIRLHYTSPVELSTDRFLGVAIDLVGGLRARRAVLDSLTSLALGAPTERRYKELVYAFAKHFRRQQVTLLTTMEIPELLGTAQLSGHGISFAADNVVQLRYVEMNARLDRAISVLKARGVSLNTELRPYTIGPRGMEVGTAEQYRGFRGVLTGLPTEADARQTGS